MKYLIIGRSNKDGYYIEQDQQTKFWRTAYEAGINKNGKQIKPTDYRVLETNCGVYLDYIVDKLIGYNRPSCFKIKMPKN